MSITRYIVTCVDRGESCDGRARVLKICTSKEEAQQYVRADIQEYHEDDERINGVKVERDFDRMEASLDNDTGCTWNIEEKQIELTDKEIDEIGDHRFDNNTDI